MRYKIISDCTNSNEHYLNVVTKLILPKIPTSYSIDVKKTIKSMNADDLKSLLTRFEKQPLLTNVSLCLNLHITQEEFHRFSILLNKYPDKKGIILFMLWKGISDQDQISIEDFVDMAITQEPVNDETFSIVYRGQAHPLNKYENFLSKSTRDHGLAISQQRFSSANEQGKLISEDKKIEMHRAGGGIERWGIPFTSDFMVACSMVGDLKNPIIYQVSVPKDLLIDVNHRLIEANIDDPVASLGGSGVREQLVWHELSRESIIQETQYPFKQKLSFSELGYSELLVLLSKIDPTQFSINNWR